MNEITLEKVKKTFVASFKFDPETKDVVKDCGFKFNPEHKVWTTTDLDVAGELAEQINDIKMQDVIYELSNLQDVADKEAYRMSSAKVPTDRFQIEAPDGLEYLPYQRAFLEWWKQRTENGYSNLLEASEMGIGKTIEAIMVMQIIPNPDPRFLVVCPAGLKINWEREIRKWNTKGFSVQRISGKKQLPSGQLNLSNISIINYDILMSHRQSIDEVEWDLVVLDEAHYLKNKSANRSKAVLGMRGMKPIAGRKLFLTGTPLINRPIEIWPMAQSCDPNKLGRDWKHFTKRYCGGHNVHYGYKPIWDASGATNLEELQTKLRSSFMMRRRTNDVLDQLPAIRRQAIVLPDNGYADLIKTQLNTWEHHEQIKVDLANAKAKASNGDSMIQEIRDLEKLEKLVFGELSKLRKKVGICKTGHVVEHVSYVQESKGKVVVFAHHVEVIKKLMEAFQELKLNPVQVTGSNSDQQKANAVDFFQDDETCQVIVLNIEAGAVGITLTGTKAAGYCTSVVFAELDWRPSMMEQAERRVARLGADEEASYVLVDYVVLDGSLDANMSETLINKESVINRTVN